MSIIYKEEPIWVGTVVLAWDLGVCSPQFQKIKNVIFKEDVKWDVSWDFIFFFLCLFVGLILIFNLLLCVYVQSESWECHLSARRQLNLNPRRSLRSSKRLLEMRATSQPKISTGHSSASDDDDVQILNVPATTVNSVWNKYTSFAHIYAYIFIIPSILSLIFLVQFSPNIHQHLWLLVFYY